MKYDPDLHHRQSIRLKGWDYSNAGAYFVTICTEDRVQYLGSIEGGEMRLNDAGRMIARWWSILPDKFTSAITDEYIIMPNHFHGVIITVGADPCVRPDENPINNPGAHTGAPLHKTSDPNTPDAEANTPAAPLREIIQWFKTMTTNEYIRGVEKYDWPRFQGRLWQRNYYDRIIRNDEELNRIRNYIAENPAKWDEDPENPRFSIKD